MVKTTLFFALALVRYANAQALPVVPMQMDPEQIAHSLRERSPLMPTADCRALDLWECHPDEPARVSDISLRWLQLDDDPELEAVLVTDAKEEDSFAAYVFDKQDQWRIVGSFFCRSGRCDPQELIRVQKFTEDSPPLLLVNRDLGGSGSSLQTTEVFQLRDGKLWPVMQIGDRTEVIFPPAFVERQRVLASPDRIVIEAVREQPPGRVVSTKCEVRRWDAQTHLFVPAAGEQANYCDAKTGKPVPGKSFPVLLPDR
jgi:hypothetical protein